MKRDDLEKLKKTDLLKRAARAGIRGRSRMTKAALVDALLSVASHGDDARPAPAPSRGDRVELAARAPVPSAQERMGVGAGERGATARTTPPPLAEETSDLRPPPVLGRLSLVARDPDWLYAWWDYRQHELDRVRAAADSGRLQLRLHQFVEGNWSEVQRVRLPFEARNWYIRAGLPGAVFEAELGFEEAEGRFHLLARSRRACAPDDAPQAAGPVEFVTIPFDRLFGELLEFIRRYLPDRSDIAAALREIQRRGITTPFPMEAPPPWSSAQEQSVRDATPSEAASPASRRSWSGRPTSPGGPLSGRSSP